MRSLEGGDVARLEKREGVLLFGRSAHALAHDGRCHCVKAPPHDVGYRDDEPESGQSRPPWAPTHAPSLAGEVDFLLGFYEEQKALRADIAKIKRSMAPSGMAWVCWRKGNRTDLSRDVIHAMAEDLGLETVSSVSIDEDWSALKLMFPKAQRGKR